MKQKHIVIAQNTIDSQESEAIKKSLTIDWEHGPLVPSATSKDGFRLLDKKAVVCQFKLNWRLPWDMIDENELYNMNYHITIAPDPIHEQDFYNRKIANKVFRRFLDELKRKGLYKNIICVYEYGDRGKKYGKLHWHCLFNTKNCREIEDISNYYFATSKKRSKTTTFVKKIRIDKNFVDRSNKDKVANYRLQVDKLYRSYFRKETQNKKKCLYTNMRKSGNEPLPVDI